MLRRFTQIGIARLIAAAVQAVLLIIVARLIDVETFGELSVILAVLTFVFIVVGAGLPQFILRERALDNGSAVRAGLNLNAFTTIAGILLLLAAAWAIAPGPLLIPSLMLVVAVALDKNVDCQLSVPIADKRVRLAVVSIVGRSVVMAGVFPLLLLTDGWWAGDAVLAFAVARLAAGLFGLGHVVLSVRTPHHVAPLSLGALTRVLWPLATSNLISATRSLDAVVVYIAAGSATAGLYSAATRPFTPAAILSGAAGAVLMPQAATAPLPSLVAGLRRLNRITVISTAALIPFAFLGPWVAVLLYGEGYAAAGPALGIILLSVPAVIGSAITATVLQSRGEERFVVANGVIFLPVLMIAVAIGAAVWGVTGAAVALTVTTWARTIGLDIGTRRLAREAEAQQQPQA